MIRDAHERPEGMDVGTLIMSGLQPDRVLDSIHVVTRQVERLRSDSVVWPATVPDYEVDIVSEKVVRIILSYTDYVDRTVWSKPIPPQGAG